MNCSTSSHSRFRAALLGGGALFLISEAAAAQDTPPATAGGLEEIIVTARKREESVQDIPVSVTALSPEQIQRADLTSLEKVAAMTPQLTIARAATGSGASLSIRGVGAGFTSVGVEQSVAVIVDGAYYGQGRIINEAFFDLARIEVLKGPQALFFGKNATAGVISLTTADPTDTFQVSGRAGYEFRSENAYGEFVVSGPLSDTFGARLALRGSKMWGGYFKNAAGPRAYMPLDVADFSVKNYPAEPDKSEMPGGTELVGRLTLKFDPSDSFSDTLKISGTRTRGGSVGYNSVPLCGAGLMQSNTVPTPCSRTFTIYQNRWPDAFVGSGIRWIRDGNLYNDYDSYAINNTLTYDFGDVTLTNVTNFNRHKYQFNMDYTFEAGGDIWVAERSTFRAFSNETRLLTGFDGPVNLLAGAYYQKTKRVFGQGVAFAGLVDTSQPSEFAPLASTKDSYTKGETISAYGQMIWEIVPQVELTAGVRYTHETKDSYFEQIYSNSLLQSFGSFIANYPVYRKQTFNNWSPDVTLTWKPSADITIYGAYKTGYKSGGFSNGSILNQADIDAGAPNIDFEGEKAQGFEAGIKTILMNRQLRLNVGVYRYTYKGLQIDYLNPFTVSFSTENAGSSRSQGVELDFEFAPRGVPGLTVRGTANYNKSQYVNFLGPCFSGQTYGEGCIYVDRAGTIAAAPTPSSPSTLAFLQRLDGKSTAVAPRWTASLGFNYEIPMGSDLKLGLSADGRYSDKYNASPFDNPVMKQKSYLTLDASLRVGREDGQWEVALIGKNLTNEFYITGGYEIATTGSPPGGLTGTRPDVAGSVALPRTVQLQVSFKY